MNPSLPDLALDFGAAAEKAVVAAGGVDLARTAETSPEHRDDTTAAVLEGLGIADIDPRVDLDSATAAAELCRIGGRYVLPYPVGSVLLADQVGRPFAVVASGHHRVDHGDLFSAWRIGTLDGTVRAGRPGGPPLASKLGPFVTDMVIGPESSRLDDLDSPLYLTLSAWRILGTVERAVELAVEHVKGRHQFGQPLSAFQAVQFQLADAAVAVVGLSELCRYTLWRLFADSHHRQVDALALRMHAIDVARAALRTSQQLFGAAGLCDEYDVSVLIRHIQAELRLPFGSEHTASTLFDSVVRDGFDSLFPHGGQDRRSD